MPHLDELIKAYKLIRSGFGTLTGLFISLLLTAGGLIFLFLQVDLSKITIKNWLLVFSFSLVIFLVWYWKRLPRGAKDRMTIGLAICRETTDEEQFYKDFLLNLKKNLQISKNDALIEIVEFPRYISEEIYTNTELSKKIMQRCRIDLLFAGKLFERETSNGSTTMMDMVGLSKHRKLSEKEHAAFQRAFSVAIPKRYKSDKQNRFHLCEFAAQHIHGVTNAIIGITVLLNGKFQEAEIMLLEAENSLKKSDTKLSTPYISQLLGSIREYLHDLYVAWMMEKFNQKDISTDSMEEIAFIIEKAEKQNITPASIASFKAQVDFLFHKDIDAARKSTKLITDRAIYYYNMAFLSAYEGNLEDAYKCYTRAFGEILSDALIPWQCEEFIQRVIENDPDKKYLHFCTGMINFRAKNDVLLAKKDFQVF